MKLTENVDLSGLKNNRFNLHRIDQEGYLWFSNGYCHYLFCQIGYKVVD